MVTADGFFIEKLNRLIDGNLDNSAFSIDSICQELGVSRSHLHRILKEQTDLSTTLYIRRHRLQKARSLLMTTDWRISEVGDAVGITNPQNFSTYFIDQFGVSPSEFRKLQTQPPAAPETPLRPEPVSITNEQSTALPDVVINSPTDRPPVRSRREWLIVGGIVGLVLVGLGVYRWLWAFPTDPSNQPVGNSLAVLPFVNLGNTDSSPACEGIMDDIHTSVSLIDRLKVISRSSSDKYKDTQKSVWQIGDELHVANVLKGSVLKTDDQLQVKVEIINTKEDVRVWGHTYRAAYKDFFTLTDQITQDVATQLKLSISPSASEKTAQIRPRNLEAYNLLLQGRQLLVGRIDADVQASLLRFDQAIASDSLFAEAYAFKAVAYHLLRGSEKTDARVIDQLTEKNALNAIRLDPANSTAYSVLGSLYYATYQWQASENAFRIALQHNPNDAQANYWYSLLLRTSGRVKEAVRYSTQAVTLDPLHPIIIGGHVVNCVYAHQLDLARITIENERVLFEHSFAFQRSIAIYWMMKADYNRAEVSFRQAYRLNPDDKGIPVQIMYCEAKRGSRREALTFLHQLPINSPQSDYERAVIYAGLDQADSSLFYLKKAADGGYLYRDTKVMSAFVPYHAQPVFKAVMREFRLAQN